MAGPAGTTLAVLVALAVGGCGRDDTTAATPRAAAPRLAADRQPAPVDAKTQAHRDLARRLQPFLIERGGTTPGRLATDDERFRLGAFWKARTDTYHFGPAFHARATTALAMQGDARQADDALRQLLATVEARLPAWQAMVDYNASGRMRDDAGEGGRQLLPGCIAAIDALEAAAWRYVDTIDATSADPSRGSTS